MIFVALVIFFMLLLALFIYLVLPIFQFMAVLLIVDFKLANFQLFLPEVGYQYFCNFRLKEYLLLVLILEVTNYLATLIWASIHFIKTTLYFLQAIPPQSTQVTLHFRRVKKLNFIRNFTSLSSLLFRVFLQLDFEICYYFS